MAAGEPSGCGAQLSAAAGAAAATASPMPRAPSARTTTADVRRSLTIWRWTRGRPMSDLTTRPRPPVPASACRSRSPGVATEHGAPSSLSERPGNVAKGLVVEHLFDYRRGMARHPAVLVNELRSTLAELVEADLDAVDDATVLADVLVDLLGAESQLQALAARVAGRVDSSRVWANDGSRSCAAWLGRAANRDRAEVAALVGRGRELRDMPAAAAAHEGGKLSARHVRLLARARRLAPDEFAADEQWLVGQA